MPHSLLLRDVRPMAGARADILIRDGRIEAIGTGLSAAGVDAVDGAGAIAIPGLVEAHTHLDKTLLGMPWYRNEVGPRLIDKIDNERAAKKTLGIDPHRQSMRQAVLSVSKGSTHIRSHVDVDDKGRRTQVNLRVADGDMGRIIGKRGRMANAIRTVTRAAAAHDGVEIDVEFLD